jgi:hypothetical protein
MIRVYAFHKFQDAWGDNRVVLTNWITCPIVYQWLKMFLNIRRVGPINLPGEYDVSQSTATTVRERGTAYLQDTMPSSSCVSCEQMFKLHELNCHQPYSNDWPECMYCLCIGCFLKAIQNSSPLEKNKGILRCPQCNQKFTSKSLTGHKTIR